MRAKKITYLLFFVIALLIVNPSRYFSSVEQGVRIFALSVLPSMLPYFFFTKLLTSIGGAEGLSKSIGRPIGKVYKVGGACGYAFVMSVLSGYPVGARVLSDLADQGCVSGGEAARACSFCSTSGSMFVLGSVGSQILSDQKAAWVILICHYIGALLNGLLYCRKRSGNFCVTLSPVQKKSADSALSEAMYESVISLALVGGFIAVCNLAADMFSDVISFMGGGAFFEKGNVFGGIVFSVFEVTRGCLVFSECAFPRFLTAALCCAAISFGGLSVIMQSLSFLGKYGVSAGKIALMKGTQAILSFVLCFSAGYLFL